MTTTEYYIFPQINETDRTRQNQTREKKGKGGTKHEDDKEIEQTFLKTIPNFRCSKEDGRQ